MKPLSRIEAVINVMRERGWKWHPVSVSHQDGLAWVMVQEVGSLPPFAVVARGSDGEWLPIVERLEKLLDEVGHDWRGRW